MTTAITTKDALYLGAKWRHTIKVVENKSVLDQVRLFAAETLTELKKETYSVVLPCLICKKDCEAFSDITIAHMAEWLDEPRGVCRKCA